MASDISDKSVTRHRSDYPKILEYADVTRQEGFFVDVTVAVDKLNIPANRLVLSCCSKVFETMFKTYMKERYEQTVNITAVDGESVKTLIDFMYSGSITINNKNVLQLLAAADYLQMEEIKSYCAEFLESILTPASCYTILGVVNLYRLDSLQNLIYQMISAEFDEFVQTEDFKSFTKADVKNCISRLDREQVKDEALYQAIVTWTKFDAATRAQYFPDLFDMVDLEKLPRQFLKTAVSTEDLVLENSSCANSVMTTVFKLLDKPVDDASKIFSIGGETTLGEITEIFNCEHKPTTKYSVMGKFIPAVNDGCALKHHDHIYCLGGHFKAGYDHQLFSTDTVVQIKFNGGKLTVKEVGSMNTARSSFSAAVFSDTLVVSGGFDHQSNLNLSSAECYIPQLNEWKSIASTTNAKNSNVLVSCEGCLYDIGGCNNKGALPVVERLRGIKENWELVQSMRTERKEFAAVACNGKIFAIGGMKTPGDISNIMKSTERYDPLSNKWVSVRKMKFARSGHAACVLGNKIYVVGGKDTKNQYVRDIECYDTTNNTWNVVGKTSVDLCNHSLAVL